MCLTIMIRNWLINCINFNGLGHQVCSGSELIAETVGLVRHFGKSPWKGKSRHSSVVKRVAAVWMVGVLGFDSRRVLGIFLSTTASRTALGPTQPPVQWVPGALSMGVKRPGCESDDHLPPSSAEVRDCVETYLHSPDAPSWRGAQLKNGTRTTLPLPWKGIGPCKVSTYTRQENR
jgi:hypothetical protein